MFNGQAREREKVRAAVCRHNSTGAVASLSLNNIICVVTAQVESRSERPQKAGMEECAEEAAGDRRVELLIIFCLTHIASEPTWDAPAEVQRRDLQ